MIIDTENLNFTEHDAFKIYCALADRYQWTGLVLTQSDVAEYLDVIFFEPGDEDKGSVSVQDVITDLAWIEDIPKVLCKDAYDILCDIVGSYFVRYLKEKDSKNLYEEIGI